MRLLHYYAIPPEYRTSSACGAPAPTDFDCLTLLFQRTGQGWPAGLPGQGDGGAAMDLDRTRRTVITCNIGDMLMRWSDDRLPSNFHRVRNPAPHESMGARYSIAFFCRANRDAIIAGPAGKYPPISAGDYLKQRVGANFKGVLKAPEIAPRTLAASLMAPHRRR